MSMIPRITPQEAHIDPQGIHDFLKAIQEKNLQLHSFMLLRHGGVAAEGHFAPYRPEDPHTLFSLSKSFTSTAIGFAVQEGLLSLDDKLLSFFPDKLPFAPCENMQKMQLRHLITMSTGHSAEPVPHSDDWVFDFLTSYVDLEPGSTFVYNSYATYMLSAVITQVTGLTVRDYLVPRLFAPLGIETPFWEVCPQGINTGGWGLYLKTDDIARFALFLLQKGSYHGKQLLDPSWIEATSSKQIENFGDTPDWHCGYGYQFWRCQVEGVFRGDGAFGQYCIVMPQYDAALVTTSGTDDMQAVLNEVWDHLVPAMDRPALVSDTTDGLVSDTSCVDLLLSLPLPVGEPVPEFSDRTYYFGDNPAGLTKLCIENGSWTLTEGAYEIMLPTAAEWTYARIEGLPAAKTFSDPLYADYACAAALCENQTVRFHLHYTHMPARTLLEIRLTDTAAWVTVTRKASFAAGTYTCCGTTEGPRS